MVVRLVRCSAFIAEDTDLFGMKMKIATAFAFSAFCALSAAVPVHAANEPTLESLAICRDSWLDWKDRPALGEKFVATLHADYTAKEGGYLVPKAKATLFGMPVTRVYPESVGMGVGFSVMVSGSFQASKKAVEKAIGKPLVCEADSDEVRACEVELGPKKSVTVASEPGDEKSSLIGCFYFYEK